MVNYNHALQITFKIEKEGEISFGSRISIQLYK